MSSSLIVGPQCEGEEEEEACYYIVKLAFNTGLSPDILTSKDRQTQE